MSKPLEKNMQIVCEALFRMVYGEEAGVGSRKFGVLATKRWIHSRYDMRKFQTDLEKELAKSVPNPDPAKLRLIQKSLPRLFHTLERAGLETVHTRQAAERVVHHAMDKSVLL